MKNSQVFISTFIAMFLYCVNLSAQCPSGNVTFYTQQEVNDFVINYPNCTSISGSLTIGSSSNISIIDLSPLSNLSSIGDNLKVEYNNNLVDFTGLENLTSIGGHFSVFHNGALQNFNGLENLTEIDGNINIYQNGLTELSGLDNIDPATIRYLRIRTNPNLSICGVPSICTYLADYGSQYDEIYGNATSCNTVSKILNSCDPVLCPDDLTFNSQQEINDFAANAPNCTEISGNLTIDGSLNTITNLTPLSQLTSIGGSLTVIQTDAMDLTALNSITTLEGSINIHNNPQLTTLGGSLDNINPATIDYINIHTNPQLSTCSVPIICAYLEHHGSQSDTIYDNASDCNSITQVLNICVPIPPCPENLTLYTQQEVNDFPINYPNCTEMSGNLRIGIYSNDITDLTPLSQLTSIGGYLSIRQTDLTSLSGLHNITSIGSTLSLLNNNQLTNLSGLDQLTTIGGSLSTYNQSTSLDGLANLSSLGALSIEYNSSISDLNPLSNISSLDGNLTINGTSALASLSGLENITSVGSHLFILNNDMLTDFTGLDGLTSIGDYATIKDNIMLANLTGLNQLTTIEGDMTIFNNDKLTDLTALTNLATIKGDLNIYDNNILTNLAGLDNVDYTEITNLAILENQQLSLCSIESICSYLDNGGSVTVNSTNATGCSSTAEIVDACNPVAICPTTSLYFAWQEQIDDFPTDYPGCTEIPYGLWIESSLADNITNLNGLNQITSIGNHLIIEGKSNLTSLQGLSNLTTVDGYLSIEFNSGLTSLAGLENLSAINDSLTIRGNSNLSDISGIQNIDHNTITKLEIYNNSNLAVCHIENICSYFDNNGTSEIYNNMPGCATPFEVEANCNPTPPDNPCGGTPSTDSLTHIFDQDLFIDGIGFANNPVVTFTDPATPADAILSDISLELYFKLNGNSCENEIAIQITDPAGNTQPLTAYTTCDGGTGLYYINLPIQNANTTGSVADWTVEFDDTNDQNSDYEYSVRFARLNYVATSAGSSETIVNEISEYADSDLFIDGVGFANNNTYTFPDPGTPTDAVLSDISLELYFRLNGNSCENEIAIQITDPAGNTQPLTAYTTCDGGNGLYYVNLNVPSGNTTGSAADWTVEFDDTNDQNADYEYSVRFGRLTYTTTYVTTGSGTPITVNETVSDFADADLFIYQGGFPNNPTYTFRDPGTPLGAVLSNISLELYFRLIGNFCEEDIALRLTDPTGNTQNLTAYTTCNGGTDLYYINLNVPNAYTTGSPADWVLEFNANNDQNAGYEYSVRFGRLTYDVEYTECLEMLTTEENTSAQQHTNTSAREYHNTTTPQHHNTLKLYPVPASQYLSVDYKSELANTVHFEVIANDGRILMAKQETLQAGLNTIQFDITELPEGHYYIRMYGADDAPQMKPFIKIAP